MHQSWVLRRCSHHTVHTHYVDARITPLTHWGCASIIFCIGVARVSTWTVLRRCTQHRWHMWGYAFIASILCNASILCISVAHVSVWTVLRVHLRNAMHICVYTYSSICGMQRRMHTSMWMYICICIYMYIYIYIIMHTCVYVSMYILQCMHLRSMVWGYASVLLLIWGYRYSVIENRSGRMRSMHRA